MFAVDNVFVTSQLASFSLLLFLAYLKSDLTVSGKRLLVIVRTAADATWFKDSSAEIAYT